MGDTTAERIRNGGIRSFQKWLAESPHTVYLSAERGLYFHGIITSNKDKEYEKIMFLNVANDIPLVIGDIINWPQDDGSIEKWLIFQETKKVNPTYRKLWIIRCNYLVKWIDSNGHLQKSWSYVVSSVDSKIKGNFRTWNSLITPQPNKYAEILLPRKAINRSTNFIIEEEAWQVIEYDHTSVPGVIYLSLTETKINLIYDDVEGRIADTDKLAVYTLSIPEQNQVFHVGDEIIPKVTLMKNGLVSDLNLAWISRDTSIVKMVDNRLTAIAEGEVELSPYLVDYPEVIISDSLTIQVGEENNFSGYIEGPEKIRLNYNQMYEYKFIGTQTLSEDIEFIVRQDDEFVKIVKNKDNVYSCYLQTNDKNKLGTFTLVAIYNGIEYTKDIKIVPLW